MTTPKVIFELFLPTFSIVAALSFRLMDISNWKEKTEA